MTSLSEAYGSRGRSEASLRRLYLGVGLFVGGSLLLLAAILVAGTGLLTSRGYTLGNARLYGGILGGLGVPLVMLGVMSVLPAGRNTRAAAVVGAAVMALGVALFAHAYPYQWIGGPRPELTDLTLPTAGLYFLGAATTFWCLFVGVANFKTRNDPGGTVTMEVTHKGETKIIEVDRGQLDGLGGVGLLGGTPDGEVETQTNRASNVADTSGSEVFTADETSRDAATRDATGGGTTDDRSLGGTTGNRSADGIFGGSPQVSDGGSATEDLSSPLDVGPEGGSTTPGAAQDPSPDRRTAPRDGPGDTYCGNCAEFDYVPTENGMEPYCGLHDELMSDMDACDEWTPR